MPSGGVVEPKAEGERYDGGLHPLRRFIENRTNVGHDSRLLKKVRVIVGEVECLGDDGNPRMIEKPSKLGLDDLPAIQFGTAPSCPIVTPDAIGDPLQNRIRVKMALPLEACQRKQLSKKGFDGFTILDENLSKGSLKLLRRERRGLLGIEHLNHTAQSLRLDLSDGGKIVELRPDETNSGCHDFT